MNQPEANGGEFRITIQATVDLGDWLGRCRQASVPCIPGEICPIRLAVEQLLARDASAIKLVSDWTEEKLHGSPVATMWRWNVCAPIAIKAAMSHPDLPVRLPMPLEAATTDERLRAVLEDCRNTGVTVTTVVRPWVEPSKVAGFPVEFRTFVSSRGAVSVSSYYLQRPLGDEWRPMARQAAEMAARLRKCVPGGIAFTADFLTAADGRLLFIEGGPPPEFGADPCHLTMEQIAAGGAIKL